MSQCIKQLVALLKYMRTEFEPGLCVTGDRKALAHLRTKAVRRVAAEMHVHENTVADKYVRRLQPHIHSASEFDEVVWAYLCTGDGRLRSILLEHAQDTDDIDEINSFFNSSLLKQRIQALAAIGRILGRKVYENYKEKPYVYDVVWQDPIGLPRVSHAFIAFDGTGLDDALAKLQHALDMWRAIPFLLVSDDIPHLRQVVKERCTRMFPRLMRHLVVLRYDSLAELHRVFEEYEDIIRKLNEK